MVHQIALGLKNVLQASDLKPPVTVIRSLSHLQMHIVTELKMQIHNFLPRGQEARPPLFGEVVIQFVP